MPNVSARIWWLRHTASSGAAGIAAARDDLAHAAHARRCPGSRGSPGPGPETTSSASSICASVTSLHGMIVDGEAEVAQLVGEHRREAVLGIDDDRRAALRRVRLPRVRPAGSARTTRAGRCARRAASRRRGRRRAARRRPRAHRRRSRRRAGRRSAVAGDRADRAEHAGGLAVRLADLAVRVGVAHEGRPDRHAQPAVLQVGGADEDRSVEVVRGLAVRIASVRGVNSAATPE